jgi:hypothetical protein
MTKQSKFHAIAILGIGVVICSVVLAKGPPAPHDEGAGNNLSFPVIFSDGVPPTGFVDTHPTTSFATITDPSECTTGVPIGTPVPPDILCFYADQKIWWLQERAENRWQAYAADDPNPYDPLGETGTRVDVSAVDVGDLLESSGTIKAKQIRTEFSLLMDATSDIDFAGDVLDPFTPTLTANTFQAFAMSGAVPGTGQSINEIQGTDFGPGPFGTLLGGTGEMADPTTVILTTEGIPVHATVYSRCARLVIQKIVDADNLSWNSDLDDGSGYGGYWYGGALEPVVNVAAWDDSYSAEITASGRMLYGYNWNTMDIPQEEKFGTYRITFVLESDASSGGHCPEDLNTVFDSTVAVNLGEQHPAVVVSADELNDPNGPYHAHHGEGGLVYVDVELGSSGSGKGGGQGGGKAE